MAKWLEIHIAPLARDSRVLVDGVDISHVVHRIVIVADVKRNPTQFYLSCHKATGEPFVIKGALHEEAE